MIVIKSAVKKTLVGTMGAAALFVAGTQVAHADTTQIQAGDTVWSFSQKYHVSIDSIVKANKLADANMIVAGKTINIPGVSEAQLNAGSAASSAVAAPVAASSAVVASATPASSAVASSAVATSASATIASSAVASSTPAQGQTTTGTTEQAQQTPSTSSNYTSRTTAQRSYTGYASAQRSTSAANTNTGSGDWNSYLGQPYSYGNLDCSGLVARVYGSRVNGRTTYTQQTTGAHNYSNVAAAPKGALVFWGSDSAPYHVGISNGNGTYTAAPKTGDVVKISSMQYNMPSYYVMPR
ncbi:NlpC/P60 family protein [Paucilactobacillus suebicus]|uniref:NLP P60 protein n=1 Tax=Paucilactobacillus suebicus DSM 5007 = KCTC 3549 TaxID=1423807 RepID=A0A0R1W092_9LACO|nr:NlpC/P60 family protein [Paucilactobacillus suebicus]KRM10975.1 NLP P60 protein [Paucilactobacillus suebicus DSM 5007 = KCTC 3549]